MATVNSVRCYDVKQIPANEDIYIEVKFSVEESVGSEVTSLNA